MNGTLKVSTAKLTSTATSFQTTGNTIKTLTTDMTSIVDALSDQVWVGEAQQKYKTQFNGLQDDISKMIKMINEHVSDLQEMAKAYESAEDENAALASSLSKDVIV
jgi:WXG100 family type VII secretion target